MNTNVILVHVPSDHVHILAMNLTFSTHTVTMAHIINIDILMSISNLIFTWLFGRSVVEQGGAILQGITEFMMKNGEDVD